MRNDKNFRKLRLFRKFFRNYSQFFGKNYSFFFLLRYFKLNLFLKANITVENEKTKLGGKLKTESIGISFRASGARDDIIILEFRFWSIFPFLNYDVIE